MTQFDVGQLQKHITIDGIKIGEGCQPYTIAELSGNHGGDINKALELIDAAAKTGASAIKIQTYRPDTITLNHDGPEFVVKDKLWKGRTLYDLYEEAHTPWDWHEALFARAKQHGITLFSSPFDKTAIDLLEDLNCPAYKIASFEITDIGLIQYAAQTGKPIIMSTGMATLDEIEEAVTAVKEVGGKQLAVLHCVSGYPTPINDCNLSTLAYLKQHLALPVGLSDHSLVDTAAIASVALGASIIEKHFKLEDDTTSVDAAFSLSPSGFKAMVDATTAAYYALGEPSFRLAKSEQDNVAFRRSLYIAQDIKQGELFTETNLRSVRPGLGLHPRYLNSMLGKPASKALNKGSAMKLEYVQK